ncbi:MAG: T9SS type A sorting domain-containing protein [Roseivirga sp.]|uniref:T9SS type A sorting domain-containing protein n=1 Tax=Roseivirga sp. TaxID=1964215 RepID=UPI001AFE33AB|nr:T9SS type A sorting domain-containing protein [Roseivirga sp.]MBO6495034.1 T9SS type A sorting domain-containing protein [Roseivirga sp.]
MSRKYLVLLCTIVSFLLLENTALGQTPIASATFNNVSAGLTTTSYVATSPSDASGGISSNTSYTVNYGQTRNQFITSYTLGATIYDNFVLPDTLIIQRIDAGRQLIIFYEYGSTDTGPNPDEINIQPEQQDNEEALYISGLSNAGYDNILVNDATNFANVERVDVIYFSGVVTSTPANAVFPIVERGGNDDIRVAAIKSLDASGNPDEYYPTVVRIRDNDGDWGSLGQNHTSIVMRRQDATSNPLPQTILGSQVLNGTAVNFTEFGVAADEIVYGYSIFADDVTATGSDLVDFSDDTNYPRNTGSGSGLDLIAGISTAVASDDNLRKATGPGGYKAALNTWLKANVGVTTATDNSIVTDWQDQFLGDHDATTLTTSPRYRDGSASALEDINFNPTIDFLSATETGLQIANNSDFNTATSYSKKSINIAFRTGDDISTKQQIYEQGGATRGLNVYVRNGNVYVGAWNEASDGAGSPWTFNAISSSVSTDTEYIISVELDGNSSSTGQMRAYLNGLSIGTISNVGLLYTHNDNIGIGDAAGSSLYDDGTAIAASFYGSIPEIIYCNEPAGFSSSQRNRIESYLAIKYGITLNQSTPVNYVNSAGVTIFNTTISAASGGFLEYNNDIAGIGRDDDSEFIQLSSQSENNGSIVQVDRNSSIGTDDTWLIWGNDAGSLTPSRVATKPDVINERIERVWRVAEENSVGVTDISFDLTGLGLGTNPDDFSLLIAGASSGADFSSATVLTGGTFNGDVITFQNVNLSDLQYFTLGTQFFICTPGNVQDGLSLWLKADAETYNTGTTSATDGQTVETWGDQSRNDYDAVEDVNRNPTWVENSLNFNPGLNWNAGTNEIGFNLGANYIFAPAATGGAHIFATVEPEATLTGGDRNNKWVVNFGNNNNSAYGVAAYGDRGNIVADGKNNFNISPTSSAFVIEGDINTNSGTADTKTYLVDGYQANSSTGVDIDIDDSGIGEATTHGSNQGPVSIGRQSETNGIDNNTGRRFFGDMQEVIIYNEDITPIDAQKIRSYLAIKYGTTLTNDNDADATTNETISGAIQEGDYVASDGSTITFDYSDDTGFTNNIAGIGRDDDTCLEQKQSRSSNAGTILTIGLGEIASTNAANSNSFEDDLDFFTWGTDGASTDNATRTTNGTPGTVTERMLRIWRAQDTGDVGSTDISFDLTGLGYSTNAADFQLIVANGGDNTSLENGSTFTGATFDGSTLTFSDIDLADGQYFTLGVARDLCAPGGVTPSMVLWLRPDLGTSTTTDATALNTWTDQSTAGNDATQDGNAPQFRNNTTDNINFQPTVAFDGTDDRLSLGDLSEIKSTSGTGRYSMFAIGLRNDGTTNYALGSTGGTTNQDLHFGYRSSTVATIAHWGNDMDVTVNAFDSPSSPYLLFADYDGTGRTIEELRSDDFNRNTDANTTDLSGTQTNYIGDLASVGNYNGAISEVLVYNSSLTDLEKLRIYSYFSIKYGLTLPQDNDGDATTNETISGVVAEGDLVDSDGNIIWDESNGNATYHNGMAGIGRDDAACLNQKQSTSSTDGSILTIGLGSVETDNASNSDIHGNQEFLIWGHDDATTAQATAETVDVPVTISERMERVWRVEDTGNVGETEIQFDLAGLGYGTNAEDFRLMVASSGSGGTMAGATLIDGATFNGTTLSFSGIDLADGEYFTLGVVAQCGPGGVNTNLALWLKGNEEVFSDAGTTLATDGDDASQWNDQTTFGRNASETNGGGGAIVEPVYNTDVINYNPALFISDQNTTNNSYFRTGASTNTVDGNMSLVAVFTTTQLQGTNNQIDNTPSLIGAEDNTASDDYGLGVYRGEVVFNAANTNTFTARSNTTYNNGEPYIATGTRVQAASGAVELYVNSLNVGSGTSDNVALDEPDRWAIGNQKDYDNEAQFQGNIAEVIVFSEVLTNQELAQVETYLALKYGITRTNDNDNDATTNELITGAIREGDYVAADGGIIWDYSARGATYFNDIAGIGRDDLSCLNQTHSKSENNDAIVDISIDSFLNDDSFLIWGNDDAAIEAPNNSERPSGINSRLNREWQAQETGTVGEVSVTFNLDDITGTPLGDNNLTLVRLMVDEDGDFSDANTLISPTSIDAVNNTVTFTHNFTGATGFYFTLGSEEVDALPIELLSFEARHLNGEVVLTWVTSSEINNATFSIERSVGGTDFTEIGELNGSGTTNETQRYSFTDAEVTSGKYYYRIKQTDFSGSASYSHIQGVAVEKSNQFDVNIYPNPNTTGILNYEISVPVELNQQIVLMLIDREGRLVIQKNLASEMKSTLNLDGISSGVYFLRLASGNYSTTKKLIIQ